MKLRPNSPVPVIQGMMVALAAGVFILKQSFRPSLMMIYRVSKDWKYKTFELELKPEIVPEWRLKLLDSEILQEADLHSVLQVRERMLPKGASRPAGTFFDSSDPVLIGIGSEGVQCQPLMKRLAQEGQLLLTRWDSASAVLFYCTVFETGLLDAEKSKGYWNHQPKVYVYTEPVFKKGLHVTSWFFRLREFRGVVFCTQAFVDFYKQHGLTGLEFALQKM